MDIGEIKKLIKGSTSVLVLDNGEPSFVILDYKMYKDIVGSKDGEEKEIAIKNAQISNGNGGANGRSLHEREAEILDRLNKEILALKTQIEIEEKGLSNPHLGSID